MSMGMVTDSMKREVEEEKWDLRGMVKSVHQAQSEYCSDYIRTENTGSSSST